MLSPSLNKRYWVWILGRHYNNVFGNNWRWKTHLSAKHSTNTEIVCSQGKGCSDSGKMSSEALSQWEPSSHGLAVKTVMIGPRLPPCSTPEHSYFSHRDNLICYLRTDVFCLLSCWWVAYTTNVRCAEWGNIYLWNTECPSQIRYDLDLP